MKLINGLRQQARNLPEQALTLGRNWLHSPTVNGYRKSAREQFRTAIKTTKHQALKIEDSLHTRFHSTEKINRATKILFKLGHLHPVSSGLNQILNWLDSGNVTNQAPVEKTAGNEIEMKSERRGTRRAAKSKDSSYKNLNNQVAAVRRGHIRGQPRAH